MKQEYFGKGKEVINGKEWDWEKFQDTKDFPVSKRMMDWVVGQKKALEECYLCLDEWIHKLKLLSKRRWWKPWSKPENVKPTARTKLSPGPYLLLLGDPGTGKSLIGRALAERLTELYKKHRIKLYDVLCWPNEDIPSEPRISIIPAGEGKEVIKEEERKRGWRRKLLVLGVRGIVTLLLVIGGLMLAITLFTFLYMLSLWSVMSPIAKASFGNNFWVYFARVFMGMGFLFGYSGSLMFTAIFAWYIGRWLGAGRVRGIGGAETTTAPKLIVDNSMKRAPFIDATGHRVSQLFGAIAWDPYQTGGLGTPEHQRVNAGDVHRANLGILYIDEIKNLTPDETVQLLTVLEDGQISIAERSRWHEAGSAAMNVNTEPVPALCFLVAAGNFDSIPQIHPALMDRLYGYGRIVRMENDMPNTVENRRKYVQFIAQECERFKLLPFSREACIEVIEEARRRSGKRDALSTKFRPLISIIKTSSVLASNEGVKKVEKKHVIDAVENHCLTIERQILEHEIKERGKYLEIEPQGRKLGEVYGLVVIEDPYSKEKIGNVIGLKAHISKKRNTSMTGYFKVTGIAKAEKAKWIRDSVAKVRQVILKKYGIDIAQEYFAHLDFAQSYGVDGPSAGVTMTLALCSLLEGKPVRQDIAVTGEINISATDEILVTAVGGMHEKIKAAERWGFKKVLIPYKNYQYSIHPKDYKVEIVPCKYLEDYLEHCLVKA